MYVEKDSKTTFVWKMRVYNVDEIDTWLSRIIWIAPYYLHMDIGRKNFDQLILIYSVVSLDKISFY